MGRPGEQAEARGGEQGPPRPRQPGNTRTADQLYTPANPANLTHDAEEAEAGNQPPPEEDIPRTRLRTTPSATASTSGEAPEEERTPPTSRPSEGDSRYPVPPHVAFQGWDAQSPQPTEATARPTWLTTAAAAEAEETAEARSSSGGDHPTPTTTDDAAAAQHTPPAWGNMPQATAPPNLAGQPLQQPTVDTTRGATTETGAEAGAAAQLPHPTNAAAARDTEAAQHGQAAAGAEVPAAEDAGSGGATSQPGPTLPRSGLPPLTEPAPNSSRPARATPHQPPEQAAQPRHPDHLPSRGSTDAEAAGHPTGYSAGSRDHWQSNPPSHQHGAQDAHLGTDTDTGSAASQQQQHRSSKRKEGQGPVRMAHRERKEWIKEQFRLYGLHKPNHHSWTQAEDQLMRYLKAKAEHVRSGKPTEQVDIAAVLRSQAEWATNTPARGTKADTAAAEQYAQRADPPYHQQQRQAGTTAQARQHTTQAEGAANTQAQGTKADTAAAEQYAQRADPPYHQQQWQGGSTQQTHQHSPQQTPPTGSDSGSNRQGRPQSTGNGRQQQATSTPRQQQRGETPQPQQSKPGHQPASGYDQHRPPTEGEGQQQSEPGGSNDPPLPARNATRDRGHPPRQHQHQTTSSWDVAPAFTWREGDTRLQLYLPPNEGTPLTYPPVLPVGPTMAIVYQSMPAGIWLAASVKQTGHSPPLPPPHDGATVVASKTNPLAQGNQFFLGMGVSIFMRGVGPVKKWGEPPSWHLRVHEAPTSHCPGALKFSPGDQALITKREGRWKWQLYTYEVLQELGGYTHPLPESPASSSSRAATQGTQRERAASSSAQGQGTRDQDTATGSQQTKEQQPPKQPQRPKEKAAQDSTTATAKEADPLPQARPTQPQAQQQPAKAKAPPVQVRNAAATNHSAATAKGDESETSWPSEDRVDLPNPMNPEEDDHTELWQSGAQQARPPRHNNKEHQSTHRQRRDTTPEEVAFMQRPASNSQHNSMQEARAAAARARRCLLRILELTQGEGETHLQAQQALAALQPPTTSEHTPAAAEGASSSSERARLSPLPPGCGAPTPPNPLETAENLLEIACATIVALNEMGADIQIEDVAQDLRQIQRLILEGSRQFHTASRARDWAAVHGGEDYTERASEVCSNLLGALSSAPPGHTPYVLDAMERLLYLTNEANRLHQQAWGTHGEEESDLARAEEYTPLRKRARHQTDVISHSGGPDSQPEALPEPRQELPLMAMRKLRRLTPFLTGDTQELASEALQDLYQWSTQFWGDIVFLVESDEEEEKQRGTNGEELPGGAPGPQRPPPAGDLPRDPARPLLPDTATGNGGLLNRGARADGAQSQRHTRTGADSDHQEQREEPKTTNQTATQSEALPEEGEPGLGNSGNGGPLHRGARADGAQSQRHTWTRTDSSHHEQREGPKTTNKMTTQSGAPPEEGEPGLGNSGNGGLPSGGARADGAQSQRQDQTTGASGRHDGATRQEGGHQTAEGSSSNQPDCQATAAEPDSADAETVPWHPPPAQWTTALGHPPAEATELSGSESDQSHRRRRAHAAFDT